MDKKLADIIFDGEHAGGQVMGKIDSLIGPENEELFIDCWFDWYDSSIEILFNEKFRGLTKEEVDVILDLGFSIVYETIGEQGYHWDKTGRRPNHAANTNELSRKLFKYKKALIKWESISWKFNENE